MGRRAYFLSSKILNLTFLHLELLNFNIYVRLCHATLVSPPPNSFTVFKKNLVGFPAFLAWASLIDWLIIYLLIIYCFTLKNFSLIWKRHHWWWRVGKYRPMLGAKGLWAGIKGSLLCHTYCDTGPRFLRSHPKDRPIQSPLTTHKGMWRIYSYPDPHGKGIIEETELVEMRIWCIKIGIILYLHFNPWVEASAVGFTGDYIVRVCIYYI
jgi:hypothetical protein